MWIAAIGLAAGCGRAPAPAREETPGPRALPVSVYADTGRSTTLRIAPPESAGAAPAARAAVWLTSVSPARQDPADLPALSAEDTLALEPPPPPALVVDQGLKPPLPRAEAPLAVPPGARGSVELEVRVDEQGAVSDARWAAGSRDPALVRAALECARAMRFFPAERAGQPVPVWCRQRFDFGVSER
jgi:TonB family protein